jgi:two-component system, OmpR family, sensor histidine kinase CpxA
LLEVDAGMRSLTLKIFVSYWIAAALVIVVFNLLGNPIHRPEFSKALDTLLRTSGAATADTFESGGCPARSPILEKANTRFFLASTGGEILCGSLPNVTLKDMIAKAGSTGVFARKFYVDHEVFAMTVKSQSGKPYVFLMEEPYAQPGQIFGVLTPSYTTVGVSAVCTLLLAFLLTRPIRRLRWAAQQIASGKLDTRVDWGQRSKGGVIGRHDEINGLVHDFNYMAERLQKLVASQHLLLRDVSHELRSPLARLGVALELAREKSNERMEKDLNRIEHEAARINSMIGELLSLSYMETVESVPNPVMLSLTELLRELVVDATYEAQKSDRSIRSSIAPSCTLCGEPALILRALENVVRNAIHYSPKGGEVSVTLSQIEREGERFAVVEVSDQGPGVPEDELDSIFLPFYRVDKSRDRFTGGSGIGLSIAVRAIRLHSGEIKAKNRSCGGLTLEILIPAVPSKFNHVVSD